MQNRKDEKSFPGNGLDNPFSSDTLPPEALKKLEDLGLLTPSPSKTAAHVEVSRQRIPTPEQQKSIPPAATPAGKAKSPPPPPQKVQKEDTESVKNKLRPFIPNLQKLLKYLSGTVIPGISSFEQVRVKPDGTILLGKVEIGKVFEGVDSNSTSVRLFLSKMGISDTIPEIIKLKFPVSETILQINSKSVKFFIVTEKNIALGFAKTEDSPAFLFVPGNL